MTSSIVTSPRSPWTSQSGTMTSANPMTTSVSVSSCLGCNVPGLVTPSEYSQAQHLVLAVGEGVHLADGWTNLIRGSFRLRRGDGTGSGALYIFRDICSIPGILYT